MSESVFPAFPFFPLCSLTSALLNLSLVIPFWPTHGTVGLERCPQDNPVLTTFQGQGVKPLLIHCQTRIWCQGWTGPQGPQLLLQSSFYHHPFPHSSPHVSSFFCAPSSSISLSVSGYCLSLVLLLPFHLFFCFVPSFSSFPLSGFDWTVVLGPGFPLSTLPVVACLFSGFGLSPPRQRLPRLSQGFLSGAPVSSPKRCASHVLPQTLRRLRCAVEQWLSLWCYLVSDRGLTSALSLPKHVTLGELLNSLSPSFLFGKIEMIVAIL